MKFLSLLVATLVSVTAFAAQDQNGSFHTRMIGRVNLQKNYTMTCLAINCPPSVPYYDLILDDVQVEGVGVVETVTFQDFQKVLGAEQKPEFVTYGGVSLKDGIYVTIEADVSWTQYDGKIFVVAANPTRIQLQPARYPFMVY